MAILVSIKTIKGSLWGDAPSPSRFKEGAREGGGGGRLSTQSTLIKG